MTKRNSIIAVVLAGILAVLLEVVSGYVIEYNIFTRILSIFLYWAMLCFTLIDISIYTTSKTYKLYHFFSACKDISALLAIITVFHFFGNLQKIEISFVIFHLMLVIVFAFFAIYFAKMAEKDEDYKEYMNTMQQ